MALFVKKAVFRVLIMVFEVIFVKLTGGNTD